MSSSSKGCPRRKGSPGPRSSLPQAPCARLLKTTSDVSSRGFKCSAASAPCSSLHSRFTWNLPAARAGPGQPPQQRLRPRGAGWGSPHFQGTLRCQGSVTLGTRQGCWLGTSPAGSLGACQGVSTPGGLKPPHPGCPGWLDEVCRSQAAPGIQGCSPHLTDSGNQDTRNHAAHIPES